MELLGDEGLSRLALFVRERGNVADELASADEVLLHSSAPKLRVERRVCARRWNDVLQPGCAPIRWVVPSRCRPSSVPDFPETVWQIRGCSDSDLRPSTYGLCPTPGIPSAPAPGMQPGVTRQFDAMPQ